MYLPLMSVSALLIAGLPSAFSCGLHLPRDPVATTAPPVFPFVVPGTNNASDPATTGYFINHMALNVRNLTASLDFYTSVFGFRLIFVYQASAKLSITYLAHSQGGKNGSAFQTVSELNRHKNNAQGLLELVFYNDTKSTEALLPSTQKANTFSHLGIIVPDLEATQKRLDAFGVTVWKRFGNIPTLEETLNGPIAVAYGLAEVVASHPEEAEQIYKSLIGEVPGASDFIFASDPDGNYLEIESLYSPQLPL